jgi:hypothetical protein
MKLLKHLWWKEIAQDPQYEEVQVACPEIIIADIDHDLYEKLLDEANAAGAVFNGAEVTFKGCTFDWNYDAEAGVLHVTCTVKPFYLGCGVISGQINQLVAKAKGGI